MGHSVQPERLCLFCRDFNTPATRLQHVCNKPVSVCNKPVSVCNTPVSVCNTGRGRLCHGFAIDAVDRLRDVKADDGRHVMHVVYAVMARSVRATVRAWPCA